MNTVNVYQEMGYANRKAYLESICEDYDVDMNVVRTLASVLGPSEDFDGLVVALEDYAEEQNDD